jgi:hypothetical protein
MAQNPKPPPAAPATKPRRGRPPNPRYRARLAAAGKAVRLVDISAAHTSLADFDPAKYGIYERAMVDGMRGQLHNALVQLELRDHHGAGLQERNAYLEAELKLRMQHHANAVKDNFMLKQILAQKSAKRR